MAKVSERITKIVKTAIANEKSKDCIFIGKIPNDVAAMVKASCKRDISGYSILMDADHIRHARNQHPNVELRDFLLIPLILKEPVIVKPGSQKNTIVFKKTLFFDYSCVELIVDDSKSLRLKTFYFDKPKTRKR